jgi:hypothetical protein
MEADGEARCCCRSSTPMTVVVFLLVANKYTATGNGSGQRADFRSDSNSNTATLDTKQASTQERKTAKVQQEGKTERSLLAGRQLGFKRMFFAKATHTENAESHYLTVLVYTLHKGIMGRFTHVPGTIPKLHL